MVSKKIYSIILGAVLSAILFVADVMALDPQLSQFYSVPTFLGPSFAGATDGSRVVVNFRDQWPGMGKDFVTYSMSYDRNLPKFKSGIGVLALRDQLGEIKYMRNYLGLQYAYQIQFRNRSVFRPGLTFYYLNTNYDISTIRFGHQIDTETGESSGFTKHGLLDDTQNNFDFTISGLYYNKDFWMGFTIDHIIRPNVSMSQQKSLMPIKYTNYAGYRYSLIRGRVGRHKERSVTAAYFFKKQGKFNQFDIGGYWTREPLNIGLWYRGLPVKSKDVDLDGLNHDALIFYTGIKYELLQISYSYDITISKMSTNARGAHEISLIYYIPYREPRRKIAPLPCPWF